jgi:hypothetical protein
MMLLTQFDLARAHLSHSPNRVIPIDTASAIPVVVVPEGGEFTQLQPILPDSMPRRIPKDPDKIASSELLNKISSGVRTEKVQMFHKVENLKPKV